MSVEEQAATPLRVGIDLGTSRSAISCSSGGQFVVDSFVGWPADLVARKVLKRDMVIGRDALENRSMLDLHRPLERGLIKEGSERDLQAARELLRHLLSLVAPKNGGHKRPVRAVVGVPAAALRTNKQYLRNALKGVVDSLMIVSEPFAVAYGLNALVHTLIIDIGAGTTDFCVMKGRYPTDEDQRSLTLAGDSIDAHLHKAIHAKYPKASVTLFMVREWKEKHSFVGEPPAPVIVSAPVDGVPTDLDITNEMRAACESIVPPIVETMLSLLSQVDPEFQHKVRHNITVAGGGALIRNLGKTLETALERVGGGKVTITDAPMFVGSDGGLAIAQDAQDSDWDRLAN
ncbi:MAG TPA: rod shape-determining protein [Vicinamibacterales bacterium]|nr:rod shape-determining protein [Vicinamibacterales bacterium]